MAAFRVSSLGLPKRLLIIPHSEKVTLTTMERNGGAYWLLQAWGGSLSMSLGVPLQPGYLENLRRASLVSLVEWKSLVTAWVERPNGRHG